MDSKFKDRIQRRLYHAGENKMERISTPSLPLTETCMEYFQDSFLGCEGLGRLDMPMTATVTKRNGVSPCSMVLSMMYAKRLRQGSRQYLQSMSSTDVFFISMMMASKYMYDEGVDEEVYNDEWAASIGQDVGDVNQMEMNFLKEMDWHLFVKPEDFDTALTAVERRLAMKEGVDRGWFTYTEMAVLLDWDPIYNSLWNSVSLDCTKVVSVLSAVYVASLVSMMGSAAIALQLSGPIASATVACISAIHASSNIWIGSNVTTSPAAIQNIPAALHSSLELMVDLNSDLDNVSSENSVQFLNQSVADKEILPRNLEVEVEKNVSSFDDKMEMEFVRLENASKRNDAASLAMDGEETDESRKTDSTDEGRACRSTKVKQASVMSVWFLDSLLSQLWSVLSHQQPNDSSSTGATAEHGNDNGKNSHTEKKRSSTSSWSQRKCQMSQPLSSSTNKFKQPAAECVSDRVNGEIHRARGGDEILDNVRTLGVLDACVESVRSINNHSGADIGGVNTVVYPEVPHRSISDFNPHHLPDCETKTKTCFKFNANNNKNNNNSDALNSVHHGVDTVKLRNGSGYYDNGGAHPGVTSRNGMMPDDEGGNGNTLNLTLPMLSLVTEMFMLDPAGFVTKNTSPPDNVVLST